MPSLAGLLSKRAHLHGCDFESLGQSGLGRMDTSQGDLNYRIDLHREASPSTTRHGLTVQ